VAAKSGITRVALSPRMRLDSVIEKVRAISMGGTDCALRCLGPSHQAAGLGFVTYTTANLGGQHPPGPALRHYRDEFVGDARAVVVGMTLHGFTLADPNDRGMLETWSASTPACLRSSRTLCGRRDDMTPARRFKDAKWLTTRAERTASARNSSLQPTLIIKTYEKNPNPARKAPKASFQTIAQIESWGNYIDGSYQT